MNFFILVSVFCIQPFSLRSFSHFRNRRIACLMGPLSQKSFASLVLNWRPPPTGGVNKFPWGASPYRPRLYYGKLDQ